MTGSLFKGNFWVSRRGEGSITRLGSWGPRRKPWAPVRSRIGSDWPPPAPLFAAPSPPRVRESPVSGSQGLPQPSAPRVTADRCSFRTGTFPPHLTPEETETQREEPPVWGLSPGGPEGCAVSGFGEGTWVRERAVNFASLFGFSRSTEMYSLSEPEDISGVL